MSLTKDLTFCQKPGKIVKVLMRRQLMGMEKPQETRRILLEELFAIVVSCGVIYGTLFLRKAIVWGLFSDNANEHLVLFAEPVPFSIRTQNVTLIVF
jgi:hypothetical protein